MLVLTRYTSRPAVLTQYSLAQNYLLPYRFFSSKCISNIFMALSPFGNDIISEMQYLRGLYNSKWVWMLCTYLSNVATIRIHPDCCLTMSFAGLAVSPFKIPNWRLRNHKSYSYIPRQHVPISENLLSDIQRHFKQQETKKDLWD